MKIRTGLLTAIAAGAGYAALQRLRRRPSLDLNGKVVLITGGSRGLGLAMAREFGAQGAIIAICARDDGELHRAQNNLMSHGVRSHTFVCDVSDRQQVESMVADVIEQLGGIDVLVNNAGVINVGPFSEMDLEDFGHAMKVMFWAPLYMTTAVLPSMRARKGGSIVNITSIGAKLSVPHLLPYSCAKFAALALSEGLRTELAPEGICVTTIVPGLMRTGSHLNAEFKGRQAHEYAWFATGAATPLVSIGAARAARSVVRATMRGDSEKILSFPADAAARFHGLFPGLTSDLMGVVARMLPSGTQLPGDSRPGHAVEAGLHSRLWKFMTLAGRRAAQSLNETPVAQRF
jgi:NAD(P)-dependent dehydrogenase (short-subunit alcohol dehydrogenase family)